MMPHQAKLQEATLCPFRSTSLILNVRGASSDFYWHRCLALISSLSGLDQMIPYFLKYLSRLYSLYLKSPRLPSWFCQLLGQWQNLHLTQWCNDQSMSQSNLLQIVLSNLHPRVSWNTMSFFSTFLKLSRSSLALSHQLLHLLYPFQKRSLWKSSLSKGSEIFSVIVCHPILT